MQSILSEALNGQLDRVAVIAERKTGLRPSPATVWRWVKKGVRGSIRLKAVNHSGSWMTTSFAFDEFLHAQTAIALSSNDVSTESESERSDDRLRAAGLL